MLNWRKTEETTPEKGQKVLVHSKHSSQEYIRTYSSGSEKVDKPHWVSFLSFTSTLDTFPLWASYDPPKEDLI